MKTFTSWGIQFYLIMAFTSQCLWPTRVIPRQLGAPVLCLGARISQ